MKPIEDRIEKSKLPKLRDVFGYNAARADAESALALNRYQYLIEQRDKLNERIRFGILTLNGASLVALASILGDSAKIDSLGLTANSIGYASIMFGLGLICAALSIWSNSNQAIFAPAEAYELLAKAEHKRAQLEQICSERAEEEYRKSLEETPSKSPDFAFSKMTIALANAAGSIWLGGLVFLICKIFAATQAIKL